MNHLDLVWKETLKQIGSGLNSATFKTWFNNTSAKELNEKNIIVSTPSSFAKEWLDSRYKKKVELALKNVVGHPLEVVFEVKPNGDDKLRPKQQDFEDHIGPKAGPSLNSKYTFDTFVIGSGNRFAHAASLAVAEKPAKAYNPLFIYGGVGLGKTHLLQAIAHYINESHPRFKVNYVSMEKFTNDFINSIRDKGKISGFQKRYRTNDILLIDDVQFLENKERTQEEFFHTFNTCYESGKQLVISSDRPPRDIATLEDRLRSRFEWGLITDIQPPDLETRIAILKKRAILEGLTVGDEILDYIAARVHSNIRELEGALIRVIAYSSLTKTEVSPELTKEVLRDVFPEQVKNIGISAIQKEVCRYYGVSRVDMIGNKRSQQIAFPRQVAMYLCRSLTDYSLPKIGDEFGGRDHTTVIHACSKIERLVGERREIFDQIQELTNTAQRS